MFGTRNLMPGDDVFEHNIWDNIEWDDDMLKEAKDVVSKQQQVNNGIFLSNKVIRDNWNRFYKNNKVAFFKDRHWYEREFSEFFEVYSSDPFRILEVGCGVGNSLLPLLQGTKDTRKNLFIYGCDISDIAISLLRDRPGYDSERCNVFVHDIADDSMDFSEHGITDESVDMILLVFVFSSLRRCLMEVAIQKLYRILKPGGVVFFKDYGLYDLSQLRLKPERWVGGNQYIRGDGTTTYFFTTDELGRLFDEQLFKTEELGECKKLVTNRKRKLKMYRVWVQGRFVKRVL